VNSLAPHPKNGVMKRILSAVVLTLVVAVATPRATAQMSSITAQRANVENGTTITVLGIFDPKPRTTLDRVQITLLPFTGGRVLSEESRDVKTENKTFAVTVKNAPTGDYWIWVEGHFSDKSRVSSGHITVTTKGDEPLASTVSFNLQFGNDGNQTIAGKGKYTGRVDPKKPARVIVTPHQGGPTISSNISFDSPKASEWVASGISGLAEGQYQVWAIATGMDGHAYCTTIQSFYSLPKPME